MNEFEVQIHETYTNTDPGGYASLMKILIQMPKTSHSGEKKPKPDLAWSLRHWHKYEGRLDGHKAKPMALERGIYQ